MEGNVDIEVLEGIVEEIVKNLFATTLLGTTMQDGGIRARCDDEQAICVLLLNHREIKDNITYWTWLYEKINAKHAKNLLQMSKYYHDRNWIWLWYKNELNKRPQSYLDWKMRLLPNLREGIKSVEKTRTLRNVDSYV